MSQKDSMPPPERTFARGLAVRKPRVDPYNPESQNNSPDNFKFLKRPHSSEVQGTWTTIDSESGTRQYDKRFRKEAVEQQNARSEGHRTSQISRDDWWLEPLSEASTSATGTTETSKVPSYDDQSENSQVAVENVHDRFVDARNIMREPNGGPSSFEKRNKALLVKPSSTIVNMIGGQAVSTVKQKYDEQAWEDRFEGRRGLLPKRYEEEWKKRMEERAEEISHADKMMKEWENATPEEKERRRRRKERVRNLVLDVSLEEDVPEIYLRKVSSAAIAEWSSSRASQSAPDDNFAQQDDRVVFGSSRDEDLSSTNCFEEQPGEVSSQPSGSSADYSSQPAAKSNSHHKNSSHPTPSRSYSTARPQKARSGGIGQPPTLSTRSGTPSITSTRATPTTLTLNLNLNLKLDLAPLHDLPKPFTHTNAPAIAMQTFDVIKQRSLLRGRIVTIHLHEPVLYRTSAITDRLWGGLLQDIQFFPSCRAALATFINPLSASSLIRHCQNALANNPHSHIRSQISVSWYGGSENAAIYPAASYTLAAVCAANASRVLLVRGIPVEMKAEEVAEVVRMGLEDMLVVKVRLVRERKRYVREREGNVAVLEMASVRDAVEVKGRVERRAVGGFEGCGVEFLADPVEREGVREPWCDCLFCR